MGAGWSNRNRLHTQTHDKNNTTNNHTKNHPPHLTTIEGGAATVRTTPYTRVGRRWLVTSPNLPPSRRGSELESVCERKNRSYIQNTRQEQHHKRPHEEPLDLYKILFYFEPWVHESIVLSFFRPACIAYTVAILLHGYWAIYDPSSTSLCMPYTIQYWSEQYRVKANPPQNLSVKAPKQRCV